MELHVELAELGARNFCNLDLEHDLLRTTHLHQVDDPAGAFLAASLPDFEHFLFFRGRDLRQESLRDGNGCRHVRGAGNRSRQDDRALRRADFDGLVGHQLMQLGLEALEIVRDLDANGRDQPVLGVPEQDIRRTEVLAENIQFA